MYCKKCGKEIPKGKRTCESCKNEEKSANEVKTVITDNNQYTEYEQKSKLAAGLLGIFLGSLGVHNFYLGYNEKAIAQLLITIIGGIVTCGIAASATYIWGLIEGIMILTGNINKDANGIELKD